MTNQEFDFEPKRIMKHKNHLTINEGEKYDTTVQHLEKKQGEFVEISKNEAARKYGSKKLVRDLDFNSRDGLHIEDKGLGKTPDWFPHVVPVIDWDKHQSLLYELDHLWMNMFFVRELYADSKTGREQILELVQKNDELGLEVLCQLDYISDSDLTRDEITGENVDGFISVEIVEEEKDGGRDYGVDVDFKHSYFSDSKEYVANGLREILTGICLKHDHTKEQLVFSIEEKDGGEYVVDVLNKDFKVRFNSEQGLAEPVSAWIRELFYWDGCPLSLEQREVNN